MKIAVCSDIHSNILALEKFIEKTKHVDQRWCLGDIVGYGPWPKECLGVVREEFDVVIKGNHDRQISKIEETRNGPPQVMPDKWGDPEGKYSRFNFMAKQAAEYSERKLDEKDLEYLRQLKQSDTIKYKGKKFRIAHSHPDETDKYVYPENFNEEKDTLRGFDYLLLGHTHIPHYKTFDIGAILNPGSIGQPRDGDPRGSYAIIENDSISIERVSYNLGHYVNKVREVGLPKEIGERVCSGK